MQIQVIFSASLFDKNLNKLEPTFLMRRQHQLETTNLDRTSLTGLDRSPHPLRLQEEALIVVSLIQEGKMITSGCVFVFDQIESGIT